MIKVNLFCSCLNFSFRGAPAPQGSYSSLLEAPLYPHLTPNVPPTYGAKSFWRGLFLAPFLAPKFEQIWVPKCQFGFIFCSKIEHAFGTWISVAQVPLPSRSALQHDRKKCIFHSFLSCFFSYMHFCQSCYFTALFQWILVSFGCP